MTFTCDTRLRTENVYICFQLKANWIENINAMLDGIKVSVRSIVLSDIRTNCFDDLSEPEEKCMNTITK